MPPGDANVFAAPARSPGTEGRIDAKHQRFRFHFRGSQLAESVNASRSTGARKGAEAGAGGARRAARLRRRAGNWTAGRGLAVRHADRRRERELREIATARRAGGGRPSARRSTAPRRYLLLGSCLRPTTEKRLQLGSDISRERGAAPPTLWLLGSTSPDHQALRTVTLTHPNKRALRVGTGRPTARRDSRAGSVCTDGGSVFAELSTFAGCASPAPTTRGRPESEGEGRVWVAGARTQHSTRARESHTRTPALGGGQERAAAATAPLPTCSVTRETL